MLMMEHKAIDVCRGDPYRWRPSKQSQDSIDRPAVAELIVITGVSGSGKSSLAFDTLYAEGQRRYAEVSAYAWQFLERMDKPQVERVEGIPPAIAIDQSNPIKIRALRSGP